MTNRGNMVFLDLLVFFPCFATGDRQQLVDLASVVDVVACNGGHDVEKRLQLAPVHRSWMGPLPRNIQTWTQPWLSSVLASARRSSWIVRTPTFRPERGLFRRHITHQLQDVPLSSLMSAIRARATGQGYEPGCCRRRSSAMMSFGVMSDDTSTPFSFAMRARLAEVNIGVPP